MRASASNGRMEKEIKSENTGRGRDGRHEQTVKAGIILFSSGTLTSHLSRLTLARKEVEIVAHFSHVLSDKPDDKAQC